MNSIKNVLRLFVVFSILSTPQVVIANVPLRGDSVEVPTRSPANSVHEVKLLDELNLAKAAVTQFISSLSGRVVGPHDRVKLESILTAMEVKKALYGNFSGTPSMKIAKVRWKLIDLMRKETISQLDLVELQSLVEKERALANS